MSGPVLEVVDLAVTFGSGDAAVEAVRGVGFTVEPGETLALVGESGSGKSTTAAAINRLLPGTGRIVGGAIRLDGRDLMTLNAGQLRAVRGAEIGLVPQDPMSNLDPLVRIGDQIAEALEVHGIATGRAADQAVTELLDLVGIGEPARRKRQYPHEFSGGMRQRVLIAIGLACRPRLLIADEPTSALDVTVQRRILDRLAELTDEMGTAVLLITHDLGLAAERAGRIAVMRNGELVEVAASEQLLADPQHEYTQRLLAAAPSLTTRTIAAPPPARSDGATPAPLVVVDGVGRVFESGSRRSRHRHVAVDDVSFEIAPATTVAIVGESGSGKSTTANLVLGLDTPTTGAVRFDGVDVATMDRAALLAFRRRVQPVFQNPYASLDPRYTVGKAIAEPLRVHRIGSADERADRVTALLEQVALTPEFAGRYPHELSGGQRQRVAIARALALSPEVVVLDEPVSALDVIVQAQVLDVLAELQSRLGLSYLFISHDLAVVRMISHVVHVMHDGRLVESGTPDQLFADPQTDYTRELLAAIPGRAVVAD